LGTATSRCVTIYRALPPPLDGAPPGEESADAPRPRQRILLSFLGALAIAAIEAFLYYRFFARLSLDPKVAKAGAKSKAGNTPQRGATPRPRLPASGSKGAKQQ